jgi:hypothetical protein
MEIRKETTQSFKHAAGWPARGQSENAKIRILSLGLDVKVMLFPLQTQVELLLNKVALANTHINCLCELKVFSSFQNFNFCDMHEPNEYSSGDLKSINFEIWDNSICKYPPNCQTARHYSLHIIPKLIAPKPSSFRFSEESMSAETNWHCFAHFPEKGLINLRGDLKEYLLSPSCLKLEKKVWDWPG